MLNIHLTLPQVVNMLRTLSEREPERVGKSETGGCVYGVIEKGVLIPVCIVGQMFADLGLLRLLLNNPSDLHSGEYGTQNLGACALSADFWPELAKFGITADDDAKEFMHSVQRRQDDDHSWGTAFSEAVQEHRDEQERVLTTRLNGLFG